MLPGWKSEKLVLVFTGDALAGEGDDAAPISIVTRARTVTKPTQSRMRNLVRFVPSRAFPRA